MYGDWSDTPVYVNATILLVSSRQQVAYREKYTVETLSFDGCNMKNQFILSRADLSLRYCAFATSREVTASFAQPCTG
jgi:hypothetical protein